ncbi:hypothetical protein DSO57_1030030 [Entomophthora muscae]|uniref:Uncharacterized protein n=3 Tax=Entomophthora muscae TaxID=34485 RepID=A0ACC2S130_9FUNG|nr:hypothetical protein DSO57_1037498 [Entomophthora muscae]KAJ9064490.1 hypothetical protein DSO57_1030030 [Entomophthora muscae]
MGNSSHEISLPTPAKLGKRIIDVTPSASDIDPWGEPDKSITFSSSGLIDASVLSWPGEQLSQPKEIKNKNSDNGWVPNEITHDLYHGPGNPDDELIFTGDLTNKNSLGWGEALYSGPSADYEAEMMESRLQQRAHVYTNTHNTTTKTQPHRFQPKEFSWTECLEDQMIPFQAHDIPSIVETLVTRVPCNSSYETLFVPSNGILLLVRYAHSLQAPSLFDGLINLSIHTIHNIIKEKSHDVILLSFWLTNCTQLLYYLKKDHGLCIATIEQQVILPEIIYDAYSAIVHGTQEKLRKSLVTCMLDHDIIPGLDQVQFKDKKKTPTKGPTRPLSPRQMPYSPRTLITTLDSLNHVFRMYMVHQSIVQRIMSQIYLFLSSSLFNMVLEERHYCCRAKALQLRMNLSSLENWARTNIPLPGAALRHFSPLMQLLELLQCATQLRTVASFAETIKSWTSLTIAQGSFVLTNYFYEVDEPPINSAILSLTSASASRYPDAPMPELAQKLADASSPNRKPLKLTKQPRTNNIDAVLKNTSHMLAFGPPSQAEMALWWDDYVPFLTPDVRQLLCTNS